MARRKKISEFYDGSELVSKNADYYIAYSGRSEGKSTWFAKYILQDFLDSGRKTILMRRNLNELHAMLSWYDTPHMQSWLSDPNREYVLPTSLQIKSLEIEAVDLPKVGTFLTVNGDVFAFLASLSLYRSYKSKGMLEEYSNILFEEFAAVSILDYLDGEVDMFMNFVSSVVRSRTDVKVYMLGNLTYINVYFNKWKIDIINSDRGSLKRFQSGDGAVFYVHYPEVSAHLEQVPRILRTEGNEIATAGSFNIPEDCLIDPYINGTILRDPARNVLLRIHEHTDLRLGVYKISVYACELVGQPVYLIKCEKEMSWRWDKQYMRQLLQTLVDSPIIYYSSASKAYFEVVKEYFKLGHVDLTDETVVKCIDLQAVDKEAEYIRLKCRASELETRAIQGLTEAEYIELLEIEKQIQDCTKLIQSDTRIIGQAWYN